jgi:CheY-like chemotaxis protein
MCRELSVVELRSQPRFPLSQTTSGRFGNFQRFLIEDVSLSGMRVRSNFSGSCGTRCNVFLDSQDDVQDFAVEVVRSSLHSFHDGETAVFRSGPVFTIAMKFLEVDEIRRRFLVHLLETRFARLEAVDDITSFTPIYPIMIPAKAVARKAILVADDEPCIRDMLTEVLKAEGFAVLTAGDGVEACRVFAENKDEIGLVTLDIDMPRMDGYQAYRRIRAVDPGVKILFISGAIRFPRQQIDDADWLVKPFPLESLLKYVDKVDGLVC